ncbi:hypothetical protein BDV27DRAFT_145864 [Aspergillus caelatus]|uniref:Alpha/Beta hydrolase protein n=1 Tax=Aspergillus caelatus TaxID=61420 RepID=A0A5N7A3N2_9EURO|nr:uncharacterized protein BDV27DRAFT_145864 [Aspergillus caelatus]KAE8363786.1 hypothetical protein BDV27DRAFT_145864 [Aspergillus caelatus]
MFVYIISFYIYLSLALAVPTSLSPRLRDVYQFPNGTWLENIAVRSNGNVLVTAFNKAQLWEINPFNGTNSRHARLIHQFQYPGTLTGITEIDQDVFVTIASNSLCKVDLRMPEPVVNSINITIPAGTLNGMATLNDSSLAISDSSLGLIWRVDIERGIYDIMIRDNTTATSTALGPRLGVNGLRVLDGYLYYVNSPQRSFYRVRLDESGRINGQPETVAQGVLADDFAVTSSGAYLAGLTDNVITNVVVFIVDDKSMDYEAPIPSLLVPPLIFVGLLLALWTWKCFWIVVLQDKLLYLSWLPPLARSEKIADYETECKPVQWTEKQIRSLDGTKLAGNGGSTPLRLPLLSQVLRTIKEKSKSTPLFTSPSDSTEFTIVALSYRGYWTSSGRATQSGIELDAQAFLNWVSETYTAPDTDLEVILWGHSLGSAIASSATATYLSRHDGDQSSISVALFVESLELYHGNGEDCSLAGPE